MQKRRPEGRRCSLLGGSEQPASTPIRPKTQPRQCQREPFKIVLSDGLWRGVDCLVEPRTAAHPLRHFRDRAEALSYAEALAKATSWPVLDRTGTVS